MDPFILIIVIFVIYMLSSGIQKRRRERQRMEEKEQSKQSLPLPKEEDDTLPGASVPSPGSNQGSTGYDYGEFRKKLRTAWKLPDPEVDDGTYHEPERKDVSSQIPEPDATAVSVPDPVEERPHVIQKEKPVAVETKASAIDQLNQEQVRRWQQYAQEKDNEKGTERQSLPLTQPGRSAAGSKIWTEKDVEQWARYDAIFGEPRSRRPWQPQTPPKGGTRRV